MSMALQTDYPVNTPLAYEGMIIGPLEACDIIPVKNADVVSIPFGKAVVWKKTGQTSDFDVVLPAAPTDDVAGIVIKFNQYMPAFQIRDLNGNLQTVGQQDVNGLVPGVMIAILRRGKISVKATETVAVDDRLFVGAVANGSLTTVGAFRRSPDGINTIDCTKQGQFLSSGSAGSFLQLDVNFLAKP